MSSLGSESSFVPLLSSLTSLPCFYGTMLLIAKGFFFLFVFWNVEEFKFCLKPRPHPTPSLFAPHFSNFGWILSPTGGSVRYKIMAASFFLLWIHIVNLDRHLWEIPKGPSACFRWKSVAGFCSQGTRQGLALMEGGLKRELWGSKEFVQGLTREQN